MNILLVNDDGIESIGLDILARALLPYGNVYVSAPKDHQSATSQAISVYRKLSVEKVYPKLGIKDAIAVDGFPADSTRMGLSQFNVDFDLVVSGINNGANIAKDVLYSGTVAAALEGKILGIPAIAVSAPNLELEYLFDETIKLFDEIMDKKMYLVENSILNINFPKATFSKPLGIKITKQGLRYHHAEYKKVDQHTFVSQYSLMNFIEDETSDVHAFETGYISITPLMYDRTCYQTLKALKK